MKHKHLFKNLVAVLLMVAAGQGSVWAQSFTVEASHNDNTNKTTFTITRSGSSLPQQTIKYRTVNLSAYAGQHYTAVSGTYTFPANETTKTVEVTESTPGTDAYKYQTTSQRSYRFEVLDVNGFELQHYDRTYSTGTSFSNTKVSKEITNLVTMTSSGNFSSGMNSGKYLDVTYTPPTSQVETSGTLSGYVLIDDSYDYAQKPATVSTSELIGSTGATAADLNTLGYKIYATVCFTEKERDDGYQYLQIVAGNSGASYDTGADPEGAVNDPSNSLYKVCFELADGSNSEGKIYFPHRGTTVSEFSLSTGHLWQQKYKSGTSGSGTGCVILDPTVTYITTRFDAGGSNDDTWGYKDFFVRMALCDATKPTLYNNSVSGITVSAGPYIVGNTFYISVPFSEIVHISGSSKQLNTSWGPVTYETGDNTNVITFKGTINATAGTVLSITGINNCLFNDLATNYDQFNSSSFNKTFNGVTCSATYTLAVTNTAFTIPNDDYWVSDNDHLPQPHPTTFYFYKGIVNSTNQVTLAETTDYTLAWSDNTAAGTGTVTVNGAGSYTGSVSTTFPIRWSTYTVSFHDNGSIGIPVTGSMSDQAFEYGVAQNLSANAFNRTGYTFAGWNTAPDGSGTAYTDGQSVSGLNPEDGAVTDLYAQWTVISWTGSGDNANDPFIILYASQLDLLASNVNAGNTFQNKFFQLADDITYSTTGLGATESNYTAIGHNSTYYFDGTFDGNNHTISGIRIHTTADEQGVFGQIGINGIVKNVVLANSTITAHSYVGGIVGYNFGTLTNCRVEGSVEVLPIDYLSVRHGGIVGQNHGTVSGCISAANVDNHGIGNVRYYGGIVGDNDSYGTVKDCLYTGSTVSALNYFGAIAGTNAGTLTNNYYTTENLGGVGNGQSNSSGNDCDGARRARSVTLDANVALNGDETEYDVSGLTALGTTALSYNDGTTTTIYSGEGQTLTFSHSGVPATGYVWSGFSATNGGTFSGNTLTMPAAAVTVSATFTPIVYNITYGLAGGSASNPATYTIETPDFTLANPTRTGYTFAGWTGTDLSEATQTVTIAQGSTGDRSYTAVWTPIVYNITYDLDGGSASNPDTYTVETPDFTLANPTRTGYTFLGWTGTDLSTPTSDLTIVQGSIGHRAYTAVWTPIVYNLTYDLDGGSASNPDTYTVETPTFTLVNPTREGYTFLGWTGTDLSEATQTVTVAQGSLGDRSYTATWRVNIPYIDADGNLQSCTDYTLVGSSSGDVTYGTAGEEGWFVVSGDVTITGRLTLQGSSKHLILCDGATLTVTNSDNNAISSSGSGSTLAIYGQAAGTGTLNASAAGNQKDALYHDGSLFINGGHVNAHADGSGSYALEARSDLTVNGGSVQATGYRGFRAGSGNITLGWRSLSDRIHAISYIAYYGSVIVKAGQHFTDGTAVYSGTLTDAQRAAIAGQTLQPCVAVTLPEHVAATGVISQTGTTAYAIPGATVTLAAAGYSLTAVTVGGDPATDNGDGTWSFTMPAADVTVGATLTPVVYNITYDLDGGSASNPATYTVETPTFTLANPTRTGYTFLGWTGTDLSTPTSSLTIAQGSTGDRSYTAHWEIITYNITYDLAGGSVATPNPATYTVETPDFTLVNPTREGYTFLGWTGTDLSTPTSALTIVQGSTGDRSYTATWRVNIPYIDADGNLQSCTDYTLVGSSSGDVTYGTDGQECWFVVSGDATITGNLILRGSSKHLILCDGATLTVTNSGSAAISSSGSGSTLSIYGQANGTGTLNASTTTTGRISDALYHAGSLFINGGHVNAHAEDFGSYAIEASSDITVNGGSVQATGNGGLQAFGGNITLGWRSLSDRIHAISYIAYYGSVIVKAGQHFTDGTAVYSGTLTDAQRAAIAGQTLQPCVAVTLPEHVAATGVVSQTGTTAYAIPGATVTLAVASDYAGYSLTAVAVGGDPATDNGDGTWSFTVPAADVTVTAVWRAPVPYIDTDGNTQTCTDYTLVESSNDQNTYYYSPSGGGWYVVDGDVTLVNLRFCDNDAHLILKDGATLTFNRISTDSYVALTIYGQSLGTGTLNGAGISVQRDDLTINGGTLVINTPYSSDAIQTLYNGNIVVNGGTVTATLANGNAIYSSGSLTINGGTVTATNTGNVNGSLYSQNGDITINGGIVTATAPTGFYAIVAGNNGDFTNPGCHNLNLSWTNPSDRISFSRFAGNVRLMAGKAFVDENDHLYYTNGSGYNSLGYAVTGHLLTPFTDYDREFSITYHPNGGTMPATYPTTYTYNTTVALPVPTREGYAFLGWSSVGMNDDVTELVAGHYLGDMVLYAEWAPLYTDVSYLDENGTQQTVQAKILYNTSTTFEGGIYTITGTTVFSAPVTFTGNTTLILPNNETLVAIPSGAVSVTVGGNLTVYGQEVGYGNMVTGGVSASGNIAIYGGMVQASGLTANGGNGTITLSWTDMANQCSAREYRGQVNLVKDFLYRSNDGTMVVVHAGTDIDTATINGKYLSPYFQTTTVHYLDENATRHTADATVLWGDESGTLPGGIYTLLDYLTFSHGLAFDGNTTLVLPDNSYLYIHDGNWEPIAGDGITVNGNLALYGQENRNGIIEILASGDAIHASGNITVSNVSADIYDGNGIRSEADILVAGGEYYSCGTIAAGTITLGYLTLYDHIYSDAYTGTVTVRTGQTLIDYNNYNTYSGTLTAAQVLGIEGASLEPYIENPVTRTVESYNGSENGGWVFLASPVMGSIHPDEVYYMTSDFYDLYRYNTGTDVWENYRRHYDDFMLYNGRGYLYARADTETLVFSGAYNMNSTQAVSLEQGFNLVGNPFDAAATIDRPCYKMNAEGNGLEACATGTSIAVCEGVMVYSAVGGQSVTFSRNAPGSKGGLNLKLTNADGRQLDNAVVTLGGTDALEKIDNFNSQFSIFNSPASLSIPQDGHRYAVASVPAGTKAVPLALQATPGEYTIGTIGTIGTIDYCHLIDRETGADVDLLRDSSYTFSVASSQWSEASNPRFLIMLSPSAAQDAHSTHFAYQEGEILLIDGTGTLEAYDALGRKLFSQEISTFNFQLSTSAFPGTGVYLLRLAGQSQKIVIK